MVATPIHTAAPAALVPTLADRLGSSTYVALIAEADAARDRHTALDETAPAAARVIAYDQMRAAALRLATYRCATAAALPPAALPSRPMPVPAHLVSLGAPEPGAAEWLAARQGTLGGSDVGPIVKVGEYGAADYDRVRARFLDPAPATQTHDGLALAGDQWEPHLAAAAATLTGQTVYADKTLYADPTRHVTVDGFTLTPAGALDAIVECKTASDPDAWKDGVPAGYVLQAQHYIDVLGAARALIVVNIRDTEVRCFEVTADQVVPAGPASNKGHGTEFTYTDVRAYAEKMIAKWNRERTTGTVTTRARRSATLTDDDRAAWVAAQQRGVVVIDIETTRFSPKTGHLIEFAAIRSDDGATFTALYNITDEHAAWNGTGATDVHGITRDMLTGRPVLATDTACVTAIRDFIGDRMVVAHNADFEARWLNAYGLGVACLDSCRAFASITADAPDNTLRSLVEWAGGHYVDAHRAATDAAMLAAALPVLTAALAAA